MQISRSIKRRVQYYETDAMGIVHHSNYVRWMEEAKTYFLKEAGLDWAYMERELKIMIPVRFQSVAYSHAVRFNDEVEIVCACDKFDGVKMNFSYTFRTPKGNLVLAKGITKHGFINSELKAVSLRDAYSDGYIMLDQFVNKKRH